MAVVTPITAYTGNGVPSVTDFPSGSSGALYVDQTNNRIYTVNKGGLVLCDLASATSDTFYTDVASVAQGATLTTNVFIAPWAGTVTAVKYVAQAAITGANTHSRTLSLINKGAAGAGTTAVATLALLNTVDCAAAVPKAITLSVTGADLIVAAGDVLQWSSAFVGDGIADGGGVVAVTVSRT